MKQYSIADTKNHLPKIIHELDTIDAVEITRRGKPVAVILSHNEYQQLLNPQSTFWEKYQLFTKTQWLALDENPFADVRDQTAGRDVSL